MTVASRHSCNSLYNVLVLFVQRTSRDCKDLVKLRGLWEGKVPCGDWKQRKSLGHLETSAITGHLEGKTEGA